MARYTLRPKQRWCSDLDEEVADLHAPTVFEPFDPAQPTGLLDAAGNELYRIEEMQPVGFIAGMQRMSLKDKKKSKPKRTGRRKSR